MKYLGKNVVDPYSTNRLNVGGWGAILDHVHRVSVHSVMSHDITPLNPDTPPRGSHRPPLELRRLARLARLVGGDYPEIAQTTAELYAIGLAATPELVGPVARGTMAKALPRLDKAMGIADPQDQAALAGAITKVAQALQPDKAGSGVNIQINIVSPMADAGPVDVDALEER